MVDPPGWPKPAPQPKWATYVPMRRNPYKYHTMRGHATNAITRTGYSGIPEAGCVMYEWDEEKKEWIKIHETTRPEQCHDCGRALEYGHYYGSNLARAKLKGYFRKSGDKRPIVTREIICAVCDASDKIAAGIDPKHIDKVALAHLGFKITTETKIEPL